MAHLADGGERCVRELGDDGRAAQLVAARDQQQYGRPSGIQRCGNGRLRRSSFAAHAQREMGYAESLAFAGSAYGGEISGCRCKGHVTGITAGDLCTAEFLRPSRDNVSRRDGLWVEVE